MITLSTSTTQLDPERPWPGLLSFAEEASALFHGRGTEVQELLRLLNHETVSFLYGKSGLGKTSLLQAGLFPRLRDADRLPVYVRFSYDKGAVSPTQQLFDALIAAMDLAGIDGERPSASGNAWAFLHHRNFEWWSARNKPVRPVFVFDQFEELFTVGQESEESRALGAMAIDLLMELTTHRPGVELRREFEAHPDLLESYNYDATNYQVLFAFREDFLPQFDQLRERLRINPHNRLPLERLNGLAAVESVLGTGGTLVSHPVAEDIIRFVAGERDSGKIARPLELLEVEPWLLSLVCQQVNEQRLAAVPAQPQISSVLLTGTRDLILAQYYASCVAGFDARVPAFLEDRLLTESGYRNTYPYEEAIRVDGITAHVIDTLVDRRLLRKEQHLGVQRVEISHDVLGPALVRYRLQRMQREADAIAVLRDISNRRRIAEGRKRSGRFVVIATAVLTVLCVALYLRSIEATKAEETDQWAQGVLGSNYMLLRVVVETKPVPERIRQQLRQLLLSTAQIRRSNPSKLRWASQHFQYMYLAVLAADSAELPETRRLALALADSLARLRAESPTDYSESALSFDLAAILALQSGDNVRYKEFLRRHSRLLSDGHLKDSSVARAVSATRVLAALQSTPEEKHAMLEVAIAHLSGPEMMDGQFREEPEKIGTLAHQTAVTVADRRPPNLVLAARLLEIGRLAQSERYQAASMRYAKDSSIANRKALIPTLQWLIWMTLLTGDHVQARDLATKPLELDSSLTWPIRYRFHARLFHDEWTQAQSELEEYEKGLVASDSTRKEFFATGLREIALFRKFGMSHKDLAKYEQFYREHGR